MYQDLTTYEQIQEYNRYESLLRKERLTSEEFKFVVEWDESVRKDFKYLGDGKWVNIPISKENYLKREEEKE